MNSSLYKRIADMSAFVLIQLIVILTVVSVLAIWQFLGEDILGKTFASILFICFFIVIIIGAEKFITHDTAEGNIENVPATPNTFTAIRNMSVVSLIASAGILAFIGLLAIWEVFTEDVTYKVLSTLGSLVVASIIIVIICLQREKRKIPFVGSWGTIFGFLIFLWIVGAFFSMFF